jgi:hypothetical protein
MFFLLSSTINKTLTRKTLMIKAVTKIKITAKIPEIILKTTW